MIHPYRPAVCEDGQIIWEEKDARIFFRDLFHLAAAIAVDGDTITIEGRHLSEREGAGEG